ncbi:hypothetical protein SLA2020_082060 [Shorea laevis]
METSREKSFGLGWIVYYLHRLVQAHGWWISISGSSVVMCGVVVQPLEKSELRKAMVHMDSSGCMYNRHSYKDRK